MKVKTLVAMVVSSMLAVSFSYAALPSNTQLVTDDTTSSQAPTPEANANPGALDSGNAGNSLATPSDTNAPTSSAGDSNSTGAGSDEESPDQATGDSDY